MKALISILAMLSTLAIAGAGSTARAQSGYEPEPVLKASDLVAPDLLKGPAFTVDERVPVRGFLARFTLRSKYGTWEVGGIRLLHTRVREVYALGQLEEMSKTKEFAEAAAKAVARPVTSAANMIVHPVDTIKGLPDGVMRLFGRIELGTERVVEAAKAPGQTGGERAKVVSQRVGGITLTALGYEKERRDIAKSLGVDPYTTNTVLAKKLDDMAWVAFSGRLGVQAAMSILVPYSMAMGTVTITNSTVYDTPPGDLINNAQNIFRATGASDAQAEALVKNPQYSLSLLTDLAMGVQRLQGINGLATVVPFAAIAKTQDETRFVAAAVNMLARYHEGVAPIARINAPGPILGYTANGTVVVPVPVDYVAWTERVGHFTQREDVKGPARVGWISGQASRLALKQLEGKGWRIDESFSVAAER